MIIYPYRIEECGFYEWGSEIPKFGTLKEFLPGFVKWINEKENILSTATFNDEESSVPRVLCLEAFSCDTGEEYGFILWNQSPIHDDGLLSIPMESKVGNVTASATAIPGESIPGWPSYLWIDTKKSLVTSLVPDNMRGNRHSGIKPARRYFREYLRCKSEYVQLKTDEEDFEFVEDNIVGWKDKNNAISNKYYAKFETKELKIRGNLEQIRAKHSLIYKVISKSSLRTEIPLEKGLFNKMIEFLSIDVNRRDNYTTKFKTEIDMTFNDKSVNQLIQNWEDRINEEEVDYDIGVKFKGDSAHTYWLSGARGRFEHKITSDLESKHLWKEKDVKEAWNAVSNQVMIINQRSFS